MTTHSDRDRSERPWWPPAATSAHGLDEPVPFILTDEPVGERMHAFPLDEGDTGEALLPSAPEGAVLHCSMCPATLADTRGGVLWHHEDGSHTYEPPVADVRELEQKAGDLRTRADVLERRIEELFDMARDLERRAEADDRALRDLRAKVTIYARAIQLEAQGLREHTLTQMPNPNVALALENIARALVEP